MTIPATPVIGPVESVAQAAPVVDAAPSVSVADGATTTPSFAQMLSDGIETVNRNLVEAEAMTRAFALDNTVPVHQVTYALEEARLSLELMMQIRTRAVESYQQIMGMQL